MMGEFDVLDKYFDGNYFDLLLGLCGDGVIIGFLLAAFPWLVGYVVYLFAGWVRSV